MENKNATIKSTSLGVAHTEHGILSFYIHLDYGGGEQGFGGWALDTVNPDYKNGDYGAVVRIPTALGSGLLLGIDRVFGVDWEKLPGTPCRAIAEHSKVHALGHYLEDKWLWLKKSSEGSYEFVVTKEDEVEHDRT